MPEKLDPGTKVRFTADWLSRLSPTEASRYQDRIDVVNGYRLGVGLPTVTFSKDGRRPEKKLFEVNMSRTENAKSALMPR